MKTTDPVLYKFARCITYLPCPVQDLTLIIFNTASKRLIILGRIGRDTVIQKQAFCQDFSVVYKSQQSAKFAGFSARFRRLLSLLH